MRPASRRRWRVPPRWAKTRRNQVANSRRNQVAKTRRNRVAKSTGIRMLSIDSFSKLSTRSPAIPMAPLCRLSGQRS